MPVRSFREEDPVHHFGSQALCSPLPTISQLLPESLPEAFLPKAELLPQNSTPRPQQWSEHFLPCVIISFLLLRFTSSYPMYLPPRSTVLLRPGSSSPPGIYLPPRVPTTQRGLVAAQRWSCCGTIPYIDLRTLHV